MYTLCYTLDWKGERVIRKKLNSFVCLCQGKKTSRKSKFHKVWPNVIWHGEFKSVVRFQKFGSMISLLEHEFDRSESIVMQYRVIFSVIDCVYTREMWVFWIIFAAVRLTNDLRTTWNRNERDERFVHERYELTVSLNDRRLPILWWWNRNNVPDFITF